MDSIYLALTGAGIVLVWIAFALYTRNRGAGYSNRRVICPEKELPASISVFIAEGGRGPVESRDVLRCSLLGDAPVTCGKQCLTQL